MACPTWRRKRTASFGYRLVDGKPGELAIDKGEAKTVRRIFADYLAGRSPREIAAALNREKVPGPRGGVWNASAIFPRSAE
jgi:site-specific DNA recombinase